MRKGDEALSHALLRAREAIVRHFRPLTDPHDMTPQQWLVIRALGDYGPLPALDLAERSALMAPSCSRIVKTLAKRGLVERLDDGDGRRKPVSLTAAGRAVYEHMSPAVEAAYVELEALYGRERMQALLKELIHLRELLASIEPRRHDLDSAGPDP